MRITEYPKVTSFTDDNVLLVDGTNGTKTALTKDAILAMLHQVSPETHRMIFRGKSLGSNITSTQRQAIQNGTFTDLWLGDYWEMGGNKWRIADFDYWYNAGDTAVSDHHLVIIPDSYLSTGAMNSTNTVTGGYMGSTMYNSGLNSAKSLISNLFGSSYILSHREYLTNTVDSSTGVPTGGTWTDSTVELPNELMLFGSHINAGWINTVSRYTISKTQLALFAACPRLLNTGYSYWTRDIFNSTDFVGVGYYGSAYHAKASTASYGVRPVFGLK